MRIAVIADIHGNYPALQAVVTDLKTQSVDEVIVNGDIVNGAPYPREVLDTVYKAGWQVIKGNHERYMLDCTNPACTDFPRHLWRSFYWTVDQLDDNDLAFMRQLPEQVAFPDMVIMHGSPRRLNLSILPSSSDDDIERLYGDVSAKLIITAHIHLPLIIQWRDKTIVNTGSVGMSFDGSPMPAYSIFTYHASGWTIEQRRVQYDPTIVHHAAEERGFLDSDVFGVNWIRQIVSGKPSTRSLMKMIYEVRDTQGVSLDEAIDLVNPDLITPDVDYTFAKRQDRRNHRKTKKPD